MYSVLPTQEYEALLLQKVNKLACLLAPLAPPPPTIFRSAPLHFRDRVEFRIWHCKQRGVCDYVMFDKGRRIIVTTFPMASRAICKVMEPLRDAINSSPILKDKLYQVEFLATPQGELLLTMIYHKKLGPTWVDEAEALAAVLQVDIIGRAKKQRIVLTKDHLLATFHHQGKPFHFVHRENTFTQPNGGVNQHMIGWLIDNLIAGEDAKCDLLEMYCGNGNFTIPAAPFFRRVLATELSTQSIEAALVNAQLNQVTHVDFIKMSGEDTIKALNRERPFRRLSKLDLDAYNFSTVLVDPPRCGLDEAVLAFLQGFTKIVYFSCNPITFKANLEKLYPRHTIQAFAIFDQFPYTPHLECGAILVKA